MAPGARFKEAPPYFSVYIFFQTVDPLKNCSAKSDKKKKKKKRGGGFHISHIVLTFKFTKSGACHVFIRPIKNLFALGMPNS